MTKHDAVQNPAHYDLFPGQQVIDIIRASLTPAEFAGYLKGNVLKYRLRAGEKGDATEDLCKAAKYRSWLYEYRAEGFTPKSVALRAFDKAPRPTWATHMVLDEFNETHYVQACAERPGSYVSLNGEGEVVQLFTQHSIVQAHPLPAKEAQGFSNGEGAPICGTHWDTTFSLWIAQDIDGGYSEYRQDSWFPVPENRAKSDWRLGLQPILR